MPIKHEFLLTPFEGPWYPGFLADAEACAGQMAGTLGKLVAVLELHLGIPRVQDGHMVRLLAASRVLREWLAGHPGAFFENSFTVDPEGAAGRLLHWRDTLWMGGWDGDPIALPDRLKTAMEALASAGGDLDALGLPGRLRTVIQTLETRKEKVLDTLSLLQREEDLEPLVRSLLNILKGSGTQVKSLKIENGAAPRGDLGKARAKALDKGKGAWDPKGDGSILLLSATLPGEAAEAVASWMVEEGTEGLVLVAGEAARADLDTALRLHHLPAVGSGAASSHGSALQVLPLSLALLWQPLDPARLLEFLQLPLSPLPRWAGRRLARVLADRPGIEHDGWHQEMEKCRDLALERAKGKDPKAGDELMKSFDEWLPQPAGLLPRDASVARERLERLCDKVAAWARKRAGAIRKDLDEAGKRDPAAENDASALEAAASGAVRYKELLGLDGRAALSSLEAARLLKEAALGGPDLTGTSPQAGSVFTVWDPGAVLDQARTVVWWDFTQSAAGRVEARPFTTSEVQALEKAGIRMPDPARAALCLAESWRRPLLAATQRVLLVTWESRLGEPQTPHPLWDQLTAGMKPVQGARLIQRVRPLTKIDQKRLKVKTGTLAPQEHPSLKRHWNLPEASPKAREEESASSLGTLTGCPFKYIMEYQAHARSASGVQLTDDTMLRGTLAHRVLQAIFTGRKPVPDEKTIRKEADALLDRLVREEGASLLLPGKEAGQARFRLAVVRSAVALGRLLDAHKLHVEKSEVELAGVASFGKLRGYADMILKDRRGRTYILDMKYSDYGDSRYVNTLRESEPVQLAVYARMADIDAPVAYYSLGDAQVLTTEMNPFPGGRSIKGIVGSAKETWDRIEKSVDSILNEKIGKGDVIATGVAGTAEDEVGVPVVEGGLTAMEPPCGYCDYAAVCGRMWGEQEEEDEEDEN